MQLKNDFSKYKNFIFIILLSFIIVFLFGFITISALEWKKYESDNFLVFYPKNYDFQAEETIYYLEKEREKIAKLTGNTMSEKIVVVVEDRGQFSNGYADNINNKIGIFTYPPGSNSNLSTYENWYEFLTTHELTHLEHLTNTSGISSILQYLHGNILSPNLHSPIWLIEGTAVYSESKLSRYSGRLNSGYYEAIFKAKSSADNLPSFNYGTLKVENNKIYYLLSDTKKGYNYSDSISYQKISGGGELIIESGIGNWIHFAPRIGISISENERKFYLGF